MLTRVTGENDVSAVLSYRRSMDDDREVLAKRAVTAVPHVTIQIV
jgi:hypothetical protein